MIDALGAAVSPELLALEMLLDRLPECPAAFLPSALSLEEAAPLPWLVISLAGTTLICCTGMLLFPSNTPVLLPRFCQWAGPAHPQIRVPASVLLSHLPAAPRESCSGMTVSFQSKLLHLGVWRWNGIKLPWQHVSGDDGV